MDLTYPAEAEAFREDVLTWLRDALPDDWFDGVRPDGAALTALSAWWNDHLHATGWATPTWPEEYGGRGLTQIQAIVLAEELADAGAPIQPPAGGEILLGPTLLHWGTTAQKQRYLRPIADGSETWCQGFSEPDAGSDLASLRTSAVRDGDDWVIDGHKIWTSQAQHADHCFMLVRTEPDQPRHKGISYLLVELDQPGVEVRTICQPDGSAGFAEVVLDGARCSIADHTVGAPGDGWNVAMSTLGFERGTSPTSSWQRYHRDLDDIVDVARSRGLTRQPVMRQRLAKAHTDIQLLRLAGMRVLTGIMHPQHAASAGGVAAGTKLAWTELQQRLTTLAIDVMGPDGQILVDDGVPAIGVGLGHREMVHEYPAGAVQRAFLFAPSGSIFGGTSEIQRNLVAERVLGLPREPRPGP